MDSIEIKTLIDVTKTRAIRSTQGSRLEQDQYKNFQTLCQCLEIRSIISYDYAPEPELVDIKGMGFGTEYKGKHRVWSFTFTPDRVGVYASDDNTNPIGSLIEDLDFVPIIKNLEETVNIDRAMFICNDARLKNIVISIKKD
jgi:hypothetical protein